MVVETKKINIGVIGVGVGGLEIIRTAVQSPDKINVVAVARRLSMRISF